MNPVARLSLVDRADVEFSIVTQCRLLKVARSSLYWRPAAVSEDDLRLMRRIDELYLATPFHGARRMVAVLCREGWTVNRKRVRRRMRVMRIDRTLHEVFQAPGPCGDVDHASALTTSPQAHQQQERGSIELERAL